LVSWGYQDDYDSPKVTHLNGDSLYIRRHDSIWVHQIKLVLSDGFKVFFKRHLWIESPSDGKWRSDIYPTNEENWGIVEK
jgi:hypothetical protein